MRIRTSTARNTSALALLALTSFVGACALTLDFDDIPFDDDAIAPQDTDTSLDVDDAEDIGEIDDTPPMLDDIDVIVTHDGDDGETDTPLDVDVTPDTEVIPDDVDVEPDAEVDTLPDVPDGCVSGPDACELCGVVCPDVPNGSAHCVPVDCNTAGCIPAACQVSACDPEYEDLNGDVADGCEFSVRPRAQVVGGVRANLIGVDGDQGMIGTHQGLVPFAFSGAGAPRVVSITPTSAPPTHIIGRDGRWLSVIGESTMRLDTVRVDSRLSNVATITSAIPITDVDWNGTHVVAGVGLTSSALRLYRTDDSSEAIALVAQRSIFDDAVHTVLINDEGSYVLALSEGGEIAGMEIVVDTSTQFVDDGDILSLEAFSYEVRHAVGVLDKDEADRAAMAIAILVSDADEDHRLVIVRPIPPEPDPPGEEPVPVEPDPSEKSDLHGIEIVADVVIGRAYDGMVWDADRRVLLLWLNDGRILEVNLDDLAAPEFNVAPELTPAQVSDVTALALFDGQLVAATRSGILGFSEVAFEASVTPAYPLERPFHDVTYNAEYNEFIFAAGDSGLWAARIDEGGALVFAEEPVDTPHNLRRVTTDLDIVVAMDTSGRLYLFRRHGPLDYRISDTVPVSVGLSEFYTDIHVDDEVLYIAAGPRGVRVRPIIRAISPPRLDIGPERTALVINGDGGSSGDAVTQVRVVFDYIVALVAGRVYIFDTRDDDAAPVVVSIDGATPISSAHGIARHGADHFIVMDRSLGMVAFRLFRGADALDGEGNPSIVRRQSNFYTPATANMPVPPAPPDRLIVGGDGYVSRLNSTRGFLIARYAGGRFTAALPTLDGDITRPGFVAPLCPARYHAMSNTHVVVAHECGVEYRRFAAP